MEWDFLFKVLHKCNFGPNFINMIRACYTNTESCVKVNGFTSIISTFQGDPISTRLYFLVAQTLAEAVRKSKELNYQMG